jgi:hypothetical protein
VIESNPLCWPVGRPRTPTGKRREALKRDKKWRAQIMASGKVIRIGCYATELEAALARESYVAEHPELLASSNFSQGRRLPRPREGREG